MDSRSGAGMTVGRWRAVGREAHSPGYTAERAFSRS